MKSPWRDAEAAAFGGPLGIPRVHLPPAGAHKSLVLHGSGDTLVKQTEAVLGS